MWVSTGASCLTHNSVMETGPIGNNRQMEFKPATLGLEGKHINHWRQKFVGKTQIPHGLTKASASFFAFETIQSLPKNELHYLKLIYIGHMD